jgi:hypothetical protein
MARIGVMAAGVKAIDIEPDGSLIARSVRGQPDAFVDVARRHELAIYRYLARRAGQQAAELRALGEVPAPDPLIGRPQLKHGGDPA